ncbi:oxidoreductase nitrogenase component 1 [Deltaproteobacteria bacterium]|nr:oxidoreductase nitrogenase component 1 [Deltaproteobacteria bacterium]
MLDRFIERPRGFCALGGALHTLVALPDVVPIMHTSIGCGGSIFWNQTGGAGYLGSGHCGGMAVPSSNVQEKDIVFGGAERLTEQIENTVKLVDGKLYMVITGCMTDIIGDDIQSVVRDFRARGVNIIGAETGGFKGDGYLGYDLTLRELFKHFVTPKTKKKPGKVNLWGMAPAQDVFWRGNLIHLRNLLSALGLEVNSLFSDEDSLDALREAGDASLNIVVSTNYGQGAAKVFEETHRTKFLSTPFPIGPSASKRFLEQVTEALGVPVNKLRCALQNEERIFYRYLERIADAYNDFNFQRYAVVVGDANYAPAITRFLADDIGWLPELTVVTQQLDEEGQEIIRHDLDGLASSYKTHLVFETDATEVKRHFAGIWPRHHGERYYDPFSPAFVIGSHLERELAKNLGAAHLSVSYPIGNRVVLNRGYAGYQGSLSLLEDLFSPLVAER